MKGILASTWAILLVLCVHRLQAQEWVPAGAKVCYRSLHEDGFLPDALFQLKLKVTKAQFDGIVGKLGATPHTADRKYGDSKDWLEWGGDRGAEDPFAQSDGKIARPPKGEMLWDPDKDLSTTFVWQKKHSWKFLKYEGGYLYYKELTH